VKCFNQHAPLSGKQNIEQRLLYRYSSDSMPLRNILLSFLRFLLSAKLMGLVGLICLHQTRVLSTRLNGGNYEHVARIKE